ncbi:MAG: hypothetical protein ABR599_09425 [Gemmatimonadota bacterium]
MRLPRALRALALALPLGLGCAHAPAASVPRQGTLAAARERQDWIVERLRAMRTAEADDPARARALQRELEAASVEWRSFLGPVRGSVRGSCCAYGEWPKNHVWRQIAQKLNLVRDVRQILNIQDAASDVAADGRVLDSAFFTNRDVSAISPEEVRREAEAQAPRGTIYITEQKSEGVSEGFWGEDENGDLYIFILDPPGFDEMNTAAEVMGSTILRLAGYYVPYPAIVTLEDLAISPKVLEEQAQARAGAPDDPNEDETIEDAAEAQLGADADDETLGQDDVEQFRGRRAVATKAIAEGFRGPWTYWVFRDRRELRGAQVFAAWINNYDQVDHNTIAELFDEDADLVRYYIVDTSSAFGSASNRVKEPAAGYVNNSVDLHRFFTTPLRWLARPFGYREPWLPVTPIVSPAIGRFGPDLEPRLWKPQYPNLAYEDMDEDDAEWAARIVGEFSDEMIDAIVGLAKFSRREDAAYMARTLKARRDVIVRTYLEED